MRSLRRMNFCILCSVLLSSFLIENTNALAQEYAVVTAEQGYVVGRNGRTGYTVSYLHLIEFNGTEGDKLILSYLGGNFYIHKGQVHVIDVLSLLRVGNPLHDVGQSVMKDSLRELLTASKTADRGEYRKAIDEGEAAAIQLMLVFFYDESPFASWFQQCIAYFEYLDNDLEAANKRLDKAEQLLAKLDVKDPVQAADVYNVRGIVRLKEGKNEEAIALFQKALAISTARLGKNHVDCAMTHTNLSHAYEAIGQTEKAVQAHKKSLDVLQAVLPTTAVELPNAHSQLGFFLSADEQYDLAIKSFKTALIDYLLLHAQEYPVETANARLGLSDAYIELEDYESAESSLNDGTRFELAKMDDVDAASYRKEFLNRLGLLDFLREDYRQAMAHFQEAAKLHELATEEPIDGTTFENIANTHGYLEDNSKAKQAYQRALEIYTRTEGEESANVSNLVKLIAEQE